MTNLGNPAIRKFIGKLQNASSKIEERNTARNRLDKQLVKVKSLYGKKSIKKETLDNEYDTLLNRFDEVLHKESKIIKNQRLEKESNNDLVSEIKAFENRLDKSNDIFVQLNAKISDLDNQLLKKSFLEEQIKTLRNSLSNITHQLDESKNRDIKIQDIESKIKDKVYQDSIRMQRVESFIIKLESRYNDMKLDGRASSYELKRVRERLNLLKEKHEGLKDNLPKQELKSVEFQNGDNNNLNNESKIEHNNSMLPIQNNTPTFIKHPHENHLLHDAKIPKFEDVLNGKNKELNKINDIKKPIIDSNSAKRYFQLDSAKKTIMNNRNTGNNLDVNKTKESTKLKKRMPFKERLHNKDFELKNNDSNTLNRINSRRDINSLNELGGLKQNQPPLHTLEDKKFELIPPPHFNDADHSDPVLPPPPSMPPLPKKQGLWSRIKNMF